MKDLLKVHLHKLTLQRQPSTRASSGTLDTGVSPQGMEVPTRAGGEPGQPYLASQPVEEAAGEVEHVQGPGHLGVHVSDADETANGDDGPVTAQAIA